VNAAKRRAQTELEQWKDRHRGPSWTSVKDAYEERERSMGTIRRLGEDVVRLTRSVEHERVEPIRKALEAWGAFTEDRSLSPFGICATEINEGNPLLIAKLYLSGHLRGATAAEIVGVLGAFLVDREAQEQTVHPLSLKCVTDRVKTTLVAVDEWGCEGVRIDRSCGIDSPDGFWSLATLWTEIGTLWFQGETASALTQRFAIYEGNLMRGLLKLAALVNEWIALATYRADVDMLETCKDISITLLRDIAQPESLYLRL
jgi:superfamily II RNA helicase